MNNPYQKIQRSFRGNIISIISVMVFFIIWEIVSAGGYVNPLFIGRPTKILNELPILFNDKPFVEGLLGSVIVLLLGYVISIVLGITIGFVAGLNKRIYYIFRPFIFAIQTIPFIAYLPLIIIWFGVGLTAKLTVIVLMAIIPIIINTIEGVRSVDEDLTIMAKSFSASRLFIMKKVEFRQTLPYIISGSRIAFGKAFIAVIVAEFYGFGKGLGYYISFYGLTLKPNKLMAIMLIILFINVAIFGIIRFIESKYLFYMKGLNE